MKKLFTLIFLINLALPAALLAQNFEPEFSDLYLEERHFDELAQAIIGQKSWELPNVIGKNSESVRRLLLTSNSEVQDIILEIDNFTLGFEKDPKLTNTKSDFGDFQFTTKFPNDISLQKSLDFLIDGVVGSKSELTLMHSRPGSLMSGGGYLLEVGGKSNKAGIRTLLPSAGDTQLVVLIPHQKNTTIQGMMVCPRKLTIVGNSVSGRMLEPAPYVLADISAQISAQVLAKVVDGFGPGEIQSSVIVEKIPEDITPFALVDNNKGYFPEAGGALPVQFQKQSLSFRSGGINELSGRINVAIKDSSGSIWYLSVKRGIAVKEYQLKVAEPLTFNEATFRVKPGICYLAIAQLLVGVERYVSGDFEPSVAE